MHTDKPQCSNFPKKKKKRELAVNHEGRLVPLLGVASMRVAQSALKLFRAQCNLRNIEEFWSETCSQISKSSVSVTGPSKLQ